MDTRVHEMDVHYIINGYMSRTMDTYYPEWMHIIFIIDYMCILTSSER